MPYTHGDALEGLSAGSITTLATAVSGGNPLVAVGAGVLSNLFGGGGDDAQREARAEWFAQGVRQGSPTAAGVMYGAQKNVSANEWNKNWLPNINKLAQDQRYAALMAYGATHPYWDSHDDRWSSGMMTTVENEVEQLGRTATPIVGPTSTTAISPGIVSAPPSSRPSVMLPTMTSTAGYNYTPWIIGGGAAVALLLLSNRRR